MWPVSAALSDVSTVWWSRISPTMITSGSWRSAECSAVGNVRVSVPTSRCVMMLLSCVKTNSIGSSIVTIFAFRTLLTSSIIVASVVDLPMPVAPVTSTQPRRICARSRSTFGRFSSSNVRICERDHAQHDVVEAALARDVDAEAALVRQLEREIDLVEVHRRPARGSSASRSFAIASVSVSVSTL